MGDRSQGRKEDCGAFVRVARARLYILGLSRKVGRAELGCGGRGERAPFPGAAERSRLTPPMFRCRGAFGQSAETRSSQAGVDKALTLFEKTVHPALPEPRSVCAPVLCSSADQTPKIQPGPHA